MQGFKRRACLALVGAMMGWVVSAAAAPSTYTTYDPKSQRLTSSATAPDQPYIERRKVDGSELIIIQTPSGPITLHAGFHPGASEPPR